MPSDAANFTGSIPEHYDRGLGPYIFVDYAADMARRVAALKPGRVLELAAGTGIASRRLRDALPAAHLTVTDLNAPMLDIARRKFRPEENVAFQTADATALPLTDASFDALACQFGVMFFLDKDRSYREAHRVLMPGGHYLFSVWDAFAHNRFAELAHATIGRFFAKDPPQFYKVPVGYHQIDPIKASLLAAGFTDISAHVVTIEKAIPSAAVFARGLVLGNPVIGEIQARASATPNQVVAAVTDALHAACGQDPGRMRLQAIVLQARKP